MGATASYFESEEVARLRQASVEEADEQQRLVLSAAPAGFALVDDQLRYVQVDESLARINGLPVEEHLGRTVREVLPELAPMVEPLMLQILETGKPALNIELEGEIPGEPGVMHRWLVSFIPISGDEGGKPRGIGALVLEVTKCQTPIEASPMKNKRPRPTAKLSSPSRIPLLRNRIQVLQEVVSALMTAAEVLEVVETADDQRLLDVKRGINFNEEVRRFEIDLIERALKETGGHQKNAAQLLGMKHTTLHDKIKRYKINLPSF